MLEDKNFLIREIIKEEYDMFSKVQGLDGRSSCQDDYKTFFVMRYSQHNIFSIKSLENYKLDIIKAKKENRNLISEKYAYMMEITDEEYFNKELKNKLPLIGENKQILIKMINKIIESDNYLFSQKYPTIFQMIRPQKNKNVASIDTYFTGELKTLSEKTLENYLSDILLNKLNNKNIVEKIQQKVFEFYGYSNLNDVEKKYLGGR